MKVVSIQLNKINNISKNHKQNNVSEFNIGAVNSANSQPSFGGVANVALRIEGISSKRKSKKVVEDANIAKVNANQPIESSEEFQNNAKKIHQQAKLLHAQAVHLLENGKFPSSEFVDDDSECVRREFKQEGRRFEIIDYDNKNDKIRRIVAVSDKIRVHCFDSKSNRNDIYEFDCFGDLTKFGYGACIGVDGNYRARKYYEFLDETGKLSIAANNYSVLANGEEKASDRYLFDIDGTLLEYDEEYCFDFNDNRTSKINCKFEDNKPVLYTIGYNNKRGIETYQKIFEFSKNGSLKSCHVCGHYLMANIDGSKTANERYDFENNALSAIYKNCTSYPTTTTAMKAFFYGGGYLLDGFSEYAKYGDSEPIYELRI